MLGMAVRFCLPALLLGNGVMVTYNSLKVVFLVRVQVSQLIFIRKAYWQLFIVKYVIMLENCSSYLEGIRIVFGKNYINNNIKKKFIEYCNNTLNIDIVTVINENKEKNKKFCLVCGKELTGWQTKFCSHSCSSKYNNVGVARNKKHEKGVCLNCGKPLDRGVAKYCSEKCQMEHKYKDYIDKWKSGKVDGIKGKSDVSYYVRRYIFAKYDCKCQKCGWGEKNVNTGKVPLQIHHIDGNCKNNKEENLQLLCPNCHSLTENFGSLNKTISGRRYKWNKNGE